MRKVTVFLLALTAFVLFGCQPPGTSGTTGSGGVNKSIKLTDGNNDVLGYVTSSDSYQVTIYTSKGYFVSLHWNGAIADGLVDFTGPSGTGTKFYMFPNTYEIVGFVTMMNGQPYVASSVDGVGGAVSDPSIASYQSQYSGGTTISLGSPIALPASYVGYPLKQAQLSEIGVPASIPTPLHLVFE